MTAADRVMNVSEAHKLDKPERLLWLPPERVLQLLPLAPGSHVADIGAGTGYFALPLARAVAPGGRVFAVDLQPEMLDLLRQKLAAPGAPRHIELLQGTAEATGVPDAACDLVFIANVWHELPDHAAALREFARILKPEGALAIVDWSPDGVHPPGPPLEHRIPAVAVAETLRANGWQPTREGTVGMYSYFLLSTIAKRSLL